MTKKQHAAILRQLKSKATLFLTGKVEDGYKEVVSAIPIDIIEIYLKSLEKV